MAAVTTTARRLLAARMLAVAGLLLSPSGGAGTLQWAPARADGESYSSPSAGPADAVSPVVDVPAPWFWDSETNRRVGGQARRFELDKPGRALGLSAWYHLAYFFGDRLRVYDHNPPTTQGPESTIATSQNRAWHIATSLTGATSGVAPPAEIPAWARPRTGNVNGPSAGLLYALADLDLLTPGPLAGDLRVAATGVIFGAGAIASVGFVDVKLAAARLAHPDVFFAPDIPPEAGHVTTVASHQGPPTPDRTIGDWLNTAGYEHAGHRAAAQPGILALVTVNDVRQALAWLCGRTDRPATCALAHTAAATPLADIRYYNPSPPTPIDDGPR